MDPTKKQKMLWRPISIQSNPHQGKSEVGVQAQVAQSSKSSPSTDMVEDTEATSGVAELSESTVTEFEQGDKRGKYSVSVEVSASLSRFIKGKSGSTQKQIEEETGTKIVFPSSKNQNSIVIEGFSSESITKASEKIQVFLEQAVKSPNLDYSHFISLPLAIHPGLVEKLMNFQNSILGISDSVKAENVSSESDDDASEGTHYADQQLDGGSSVGIRLKDEKEQVEVDVRKIASVSYPPKVLKSSNLADLGIEKSIFIKPKTFHLTVLMLKLWNNERVTAATEVLQRISSKVMDVLEGRPVYVRLKGLERMRGSLAKAQVLYTPVEVIGGEERLLRACQVITDAYIEAGLVLEKDKGHKLKLHGTVMNVKHRKRQQRTKRFDSFDARTIFEQYGSEDWGEYIIPEVHLSQRFKFDENGYYHCCASIPFPENEKAE